MWRPAPANVKDPCTHRAHLFFTKTKKKSGESLRCVDQYAAALYSCGSVWISRTSGACSLRTSATTLSSWISTCWTVSFHVVFLRAPARQIVKWHSCIRDGRAHTYTHARAHTHTRTHAHTHAQTRTHTRTHTHMHRHAHAHTHTLEGGGERRSMTGPSVDATHTHTHTHAHMHSRMHTHAHMHSRMHTRTHTHTHASGTKNKQNVCHRILSLAGLGIWTRKHTHAHTQTKTHAHTRTVRNKRLSLCALCQLQDTAQTHAHMCTHTHAYTHTHTHTCALYQLQDPASCNSPARSSASVL